MHWIHDVHGHKLIKESVAALAWAVPIAIGAGWYWQIRDANKQRMTESCASCVRSLFKLREMPYRIRRRTSDSPEALAALAERFHDLQEEIDYWITWSAEADPVIGVAFKKAAGKVRRIVGAYVDDAWHQPHVGDAKGMVLKNSPAGLYAMDDVEACIGELNASIAGRRGRKFKWPKRT